MIRSRWSQVGAHDGHDARAIQAWLGHKNLQHVVRYTKWRRTDRNARSE